MTAVANARDLVLALLAARAADATICPSEVARALARVASTGPTAVDWRGMMPTVHVAVDGMVAEGLLELSWKGRMLAARTGPYRIRRRPPG